MALFNGGRLHTNESCRLELSSWERTVTPGYQQAWQSRILPSRCVAWGLLSFLVKQWKLPSPLMFSLDLASQPQATQS